MVRAHDLLRLNPIAESIADAPEWARCSLTRAPWVVVRRDQAPAGRLPVGVRGFTRGQRWGTTIPLTIVAERLTPEQLVGRIDGMSPRTPAAQALATLHSQLRTLPRCWGPTGSAGFELASGYPTLRAESDLDIVIRAGLQADVLARICQELPDLPVRVDAQVDLGFGAVALGELRSGASEVLVKTVTGPVLMPITQVTCISQPETR